MSLIGESRVCFIDSMAGDLPSVAKGHKNEQLQVLVDCSAIIPPGEEKEH